MLGYIYIVTKGSVSVLVMGVAINQNKSPLAKHVIFTIGQITFFYLPNGKKPKNPWVFWFHSLRQPKLSFVLAGVNE